MYVIRTVWRAFGSLHVFLSEIFAMQKCVSTSNFHQSHAVSIGYYCSVHLYLTYLAGKLKVLCVVLDMSCLSGSAVFFIIIPSTTRFLGKIGLY